MTISTCDRCAFIEFGVPTAVISLVVFVCTFVYIYIYLYISIHICNIWPESLFVQIINGAVALHWIEAAGPDPIKPPHRIWNLSKQLEQWHINNYGGHDRGIHINFTVMIFGALMKGLNISEWYEDDCDKLWQQEAHVVGEVCWQFMDCICTLYIQGVSILLTSTCILCLLLLITNMRREILNWLCYILKWKPI